MQRVSPRLKFEELKLSVFLDFGSGIGRRRMDFTRRPSSDLKTWRPGIRVGHCGYLKGGQESDRVSYSNNVSWSHVKERLFRAQLLQYSLAVCQTR